MIVARLRIKESDSGGRRDRCMTEEILDRTIVTPQALGYNSHMATRKSISEQLRAALKHSGVSRYEVAKQTTISESQLSRFANMKSQLSLDSVDKLAKYLKLELHPKNE